MNFFCRTPSPHDGRQLFFISLDLLSLVISPDKQRQAQMQVSNHFNRRLCLISRSLCSRFDLSSLCTRFFLLENYFFHVLARGGRSPSTAHSGIQHFCIGTRHMQYLFNRIFQMFPTTPSLTCSRIQEVKTLQDLEKKQALVMCEPTQQSHRRKDTGHALQPLQGQGAGGRTDEGSQAIVVDRLFG